MGNVVGSNIANILFIIGAAALICPISANRNHFLRDSTILVGATAIFVVFAFSGTFGRIPGIFMLSCLFAFLAFSYVQGRKYGNDDLSLISVGEANEAVAISLALSGAWVVGGLLAVAFGAELLVNGATTIARSLGVSEEVIGLTMVAIGTSLPELATVIAAAAKKHTDVIVGNVMGSNIFNIFGVMGTTAIVTDVPVTSQILNLDIWVMAATAVLLVPFMLSGSFISRREGVICLALYCFYIAVQYVDLETLV